MVKNLELDDLCCSNICLLAAKIIRRHVFPRMILWCIWRKLWVLAGLVGVSDRERWEF